MSEPTRRYRSARREQGAAQTRQDILETARTLFVTHGYAQVTMGEIARSAGVATKTLYASVGTKAQLLQALLDQDLAQPLEVADEALRHKDLSSSVACLAHAVRTSTERFASSAELLQASMTSDDQARQTWEDATAQYRQALRKVARHLHSVGAVAPHIDVKGTTDRLWLSLGPAAWRSLVVQCGWSYDSAEHLLTRQAVSLLQDPDPVPDQ
ncbi:TetR/AcrR family transcriptional regulator [Streptomyces tendae]|uniref:TetR/AcrR family transcriptional regulator n=1 Tax=Streptomyces tendae TaxID=1932 RepID=UPI0037A29C8E